MFASINIANRILVNHPIVIFDCSIRVFDCSIKEYQAPFHSLCG